MHENPPYYSSATSPQMYAHSASPRLENRQCCFDPNSNPLIESTQLAPLAPQPKISLHVSLPSLYEVLRGINLIPHQHAKEGIQKRPRRKFHEVKRIYSCDFPGCEKAYGALNHLNSHILSQNHGCRKRASDFHHITRQ